MGLLAWLGHGVVEAQTRGGGVGGSSSSGGFGSSMGGSGFGSSGGGFGSGGGGLTGGFGASGGSGFTGGGLSLSGGGGITGAGAVGGGAIGGGRGTSTGGVSNQNPFATYYVNPLAIGLSAYGGSTGSMSGGGLGGTSTVRTIAFGQPLYGTTTTTTGNFTGGTANIQGGSSATSVYQGSSSIGVRRAPAYSTTIAFDYKPEPSNSVQAKVQAFIKQSSKLNSKDSISVSLEGDTFVLKGTALNDHDKRLAEALARLTPGVRSLRNEIDVPSAAGP